MANHQHAAEIVVWRPRCKVIRNHSATTAQPAPGGPAGCSGSGPGGIMADGYSAIYRCERALIQFKSRRPVPAVFYVSTTAGTRTNLLPIGTRRGSVRKYELVPRPQFTSWPCSG